MIKYDQLDHTQLRTLQQAAMMKVKWGVRSMHGILSVTTMLRPVIHTQVMYPM